MAVVSALSATALLLAGCGSGEEEPTESASQQKPAAEQQEESTDSEDSTETKSDHEAEEPAEDEQASNPDAPSEATAPGTELKFGEQAILPVTKDDKEHLVGVTVTAIEKGDAKAMRQQFGEQAEGITPYYLRYEVENLDGSDLSFISAPSVRGTGPDGAITGAVVTGSLGDCESGSAPEDFAEAGATFEGCELEGSGSGEVVEAKYDSDDYYENPVVWKG